MKAYKTLCLPIHLLLVVRLAYVFASVNYFALKIDVWIFEYLFSFPSGLHLGMDLQGHVLVLHETFEELPNCFSH